MIVYHFVEIATQPLTHSHRYRERFTLKLGNGYAGLRMRLAHLADISFENPTSLLRLIFLQEVFILFRLGEVEAPREERIHVYCLMPDEICQTVHEADL